MSGPTIGRAEIKVDFDGDALAAQAAKIGKQAGGKAGYAYGEAFSDQMDTASKQIAGSMARYGKLGSESLTQSIEKALKRSMGRIRNEVGSAFATRGGFEEFTKNVGGTETALGRLEKALQRAHSLGEISEARYKSLGKQVNGWAKEIDHSDALLQDFNQEKAKGIKLANDFAAAEKLSTEVLRDHDRALKIVANGASQEKIRAASEGMTEQNKRLSDSLRDLNLIVKNRKTWDLFSSSVGGGEEATKRLNAQIGDLSRNGKLSGFQIDVLADKMREYGVVVDKVDGSMRNHSRSVDRSTRAHKSLWKGLSANTRQWTLIIAAIASAGAEISILGSVAGSSLAVLGTAFTAVGAGAIVGVAAFQGMMGPLSEIEEAARPAAIALKDMGAAMSELQNGIQASLFKDLAGPFNALTDVLPQLQDGLNLVAGAVGTFLGNLALGLGSADGISKLNALFVGMAPIIVSLGDAMIALGSALGTIFIAALPATLAFANGLDAMMSRFSTFLSSADGQTALATFFDHLMTVMPPLLGLVGAAGNMLASLITPDTVAKMVAFLGNLTEFMPALGTLLGMLAQLNIFGLIAAGLNIFSQALAPLAPGLTDLATLISGTVMSLFAALAPAITQIADAIAPVLPVLGELISSFADALIPLIGPVAGLIASLIPIIVALALPLADLAMVVLETLIPPLAEFTSWLGDNMGLVAGIASVIAGAVVGFKAMAVVVKIISVATRIWGVVTAITGGIVAIATAPVTLIAIAIGALVAGIIYLATQTTFFQDAWVVMVDIFHNSVGMFSDFFASTGGMFADFFSNTIGMVTDFVSNTVGMFQDFVSNTVGMFVDFGTAILAPFVSIATAILDFFAPIVEGIATIVGAVIGFWASLGNDILGFIVDIAVMILTPFMPFIELMAGFLDLVISFWSAVPARIHAFIDGIAASVIAFFAPLVELMSAIIDVTIGFWSALPGRIYAFLVTIATRIIQFFLPIVAGISGFINSVIGFWAALPGKIFGFLASIGARIIAFFTPMVSGVSGKVDKVSGFFTGLPGRIAGSMSGMSTKISAFFDALPGKIKSIVDRVVGFFTGLPGRIMGAIGNMAGRIGDALGIGNIKLPGFAAGTLADKPTLGIFGEAGPEAVVPLNRPLSQVDPAVRELSAFAQGKRPADTGTGAGRSVTVAAGAIVIQTAANPFLTANAVLDRFVASAR